MMIVETLMMSAFAMYILSIALLSIRAIKGPTVGDQVLAIDVITYISIVIFILLSVYLREPFLAVVAIPLALWVYALDIYIAKYLEKGDLGA